MRIYCNPGIKFMHNFLSSYPHLKKYLGWLNTPRCAINFESIAQFRLPVAIDNSAFSDFNADRYMSLIKRISVPILWITVPDVVGDAKRTNELWEIWKPLLDVPFQCEKLPLAYVGQDGSEDLIIPWDEFECLFIGGTTEWKLSRSVLSIINEAKVNGKIVHMGRVNSEKRLRHAYMSGCDSVDGSGYSKYSKNELYNATEYVNSLHTQMSLF